MSRIHPLQHWFNLADNAFEEALYDIASLRCFVGIDLLLGAERVPDESAVLKFRHLLEKHDLGKKLPKSAKNERRVYGDSAYASQKELLQGKAPNAQDFTNQRTRKAGCEVDEVKTAKNRSKSKIRSRVEHVFAVVKRLWRFDKVRYRGLAKNATRAFVTLAMANVYLAGSV
jgi:transposase, IS5 family